MNDLKNRKKIIYIVTKSNWGGAQKYVYDLATFFDKDGFDVIVVLGGNDELKKKCEEKNIRVISLTQLSRDISIKDELKVFFSLLKIFRKEKPDVVHLNSSKIGGLGSLAGRIANVKKIIFTAHGWAFNEDRNWVQKLIIKFLSWLTVLFSHKTITVAKREKEQMVDFPFVSSKISIIYNAVKPVDFMEKEEARKKLLGEYKEGFVWVGTIAELHKNKGLKYAIDAIGLLKEEEKKVIFVIISDGEEKENLEKIINQKNLNDRVFLVGKYDEAAKLLKAFDMFLLPSIKEGLPYVLLEAGLAKLPVIATNVGGISEIIKNMETGMVIRPKNSKEIYLAILYMMSHFEKSNYFKNNLQKEVKEKFGFERMINETKNLY